MIPQAGSAYAYSYATLGELVAWIIGWDLILEYAVGNVAVAISWGDYFNTLLRGFGITLAGVADDGLPDGAPELRPGDPRAAADRAAHRGHSRSSCTCRRSAIVMLITWLLLQGAKESVTANNIMVVIKLLALGLFIAVGATHLHAANYHPFAPNGFTGIHQGAAIVFFAYIGFDAISTAAEETNNPQRNLPIGILGGLAICTLIYVIVGFVLTGMVPVHRAGGRGSAGARAAARRLQRGRLDRGARRGRVDVGGAARLSVRAAAHLLRDGARRAAPAWAAQHPSADEDPLRHDAVDRHLRGLVVARRRRGRDLRSDQHRHALRVHPRQHRRARAALHRPVRPRPFRVPFVWPVTLLSTAACLFIMIGLPRQAWERFGYWLVIGLVLYFVYGYQHSRLQARYGFCRLKRLSFRQRRKLHIVQFADSSVLDRIRVVK